MFWGDIKWPTDVEEWTTISIRVQKCCEMKDMGEGGNASLVD